MSDTTINDEEQPIVDKGMTALVEEISPDIVPQKIVKLKTNHIIYTGRAGKIFIILLTNALLMFPTLGIYRFWAKTKLRRYITGQIHLGSDAFEYSGTGKELFFGFLKILPLVIILSIPYIVLNMNAAPPTWAIVLFIISVPIIYYFVQAGIYASIRYRANRTKWRGIRGHLKGSAFSYATLAICRAILNTVSLGFLKPSSDIKKHDYIMNNMYFGTEKAEYHPDTKGLYKAYMPLYLISIGLIALFAYSNGYSTYKFFSDTQERQAKIEQQFEKDFDTSDMSHYERQFALQEYKKQTIHLDNGEVIDPKISNAEKSQALEFFKAIGLFYAYLLIALPLLLAVYQAAFLRKKLENLKLKDIRFKSKVSAWKLIKLRIGNLFIIILTFGMGRCFIINRRMKFFAKNTVIGGDLNQFLTRQVERSKLGHGEELADTLDADLGIDFGFGG